MKSKTLKKTLMLSQIQKIVLLVICFSLLSSPCFSEQPEYAFILQAKGNPYWNAIIEGVNDKSKELNVRSLTYQIDEIRDSEAQLNLCNTVIQKRPAIIVLSAITNGIGLECFKNALLKGIKVAEIDSQIYVEAREKGIPFSFSIGSDNFRIGQEAGEYLNSINRKAKPTILVIEGVTGNYNSEKRVGGFKTKLLELVPNARIVASIAGDWDRLKAASITTDILTKESNLDYIFSASDNMTYGIIESIKVAKRLDVKVISVDGQKQILGAIRSGKLEATVVQLPYLMGVKAVELSVKAVNENLLGHRELTETPVVNKEFLEKQDSPVFKYIR